MNSRINETTYEAVPKRFFVTGGAGFIGSHLVDFLLKQGHFVNTIDNLTTGSINNLISANQYSNHRFFYQDVIDFEWDKYLCRGDTVIHLAATVGVEKVSENALKTLFNNYYPTKLLLDYCKKINCRMIYISTSEVYGNTKNAGCKETDSLNVNIFHNGRSAYTLAKLYGELLCLTYSTEFNLSITILRLFNTIGTRQSHLYGMVVPSFIKQALNNFPITVFDDGLQTRSFCDVSDIIKGIYQVSLSKKSDGQIYNMGNNKAITILDLAHYIRDFVGSKSEIVFLSLPPERANNADIRYRRPDLTKIINDFSWSPQVTWQKSIEAIVESKKPYSNNQEIQHACIINRS